MPKMAFNVPHSLGQEKAQERLKQFMPKVREHYQGQVSEFDESWEDNKLKFSLGTFGIKIAGAIEVNDDNVAFQGNLPMTAMMFKGKIEDGIREELTKLLS